MTEERPSPLRHDTDIVLPAAAYLRYEQRADGWSAGRQAACLAHLADNGIAADAVRSVGMSMQGSYALRRTARGYAFNLGWEAALIIARRIVTDELMTAAIRGEQSVWLREDGKTTFTRQNSKLSLTLLDRVNPATALPEVMAVAVRFDCFLMMIDDGLSAQQLWDYFFDNALAHDQIEARTRVRAALQLSEESGGFEEKDGDEDAPEPPIEYKSMEGAPHAGNASSPLESGSGPFGGLMSPEGPKHRRGRVGLHSGSPVQRRKGSVVRFTQGHTQSLWFFGASGDIFFDAVDAVNYGLAQTPLTAAHRSSVETHLRLPRPQSTPYPWKAAFAANFV